MHQYIKQLSHTNSNFGAPLNTYLNRKDLSPPTLKHWVSSYRGNSLQGFQNCVKGWGKSP